MPQPSSDAHLPSWAEVSDRHPCDALLLGNGASRAIWKPFGYFSLFEQAQQVRHKALGVSDQALFKSLGSELFEPVLSALNTTVRANAALAIGSTAPLNRYYSIKEALIHAVRAVHVPFGRLPEPTLQRLNTELRRYARVYTSNYDLLLPWAVQQAPDGFASRFDEQGFFDVRQRVGTGTQIVHLHGGLHLLKLPDGSTRQRAARGSELLDGFAVNLPGEVPLFVNEGPSDDKLRVIRHSDYLSASLSELAHERRGLCLLGQHLDNGDQHLLEALRQARPKHLVIGLRSVGDAAVLNQKRHFNERFADLASTPVHFFDAASHPLTMPDLAVAVPTPRR